MSKIYRLMIYFVFATICIYEESITYTGRKMTGGEFYDKNKSVIDRVREEAINLFSYDLSESQIGSGVLTYLTWKVNPQKVENTEAFILK